MADQPLFGVFQEEKGLAVSGEPYDKPVDVHTRHNGKQFEVPDCTAISGKGPDTWFDKSLKLATPADQYSEPLDLPTIVAARAKPSTAIPQSGGRPLHDKPFRPSNPSQRPGKASGSLYGTFGPISLFFAVPEGSGDHSDTRRPITAPVDTDALGNIYTKPPRKGGPGYPDQYRLLSGGSYTYVPDEYQRGRTLEKALKHEARARIPKPFWGRTRANGVFTSDSELYAVPPAKSPTRSRSASDGRPAWRPNNPAPKGKYCGLLSSPTYIPSPAPPEKGIDVQRKITLLQGHWWTRIEDAVDLLAKTYSAACASIWILDEAADSFVALLSKGPMRQAVQPGCAVHLRSEYDPNSPSSLTSLWETKAVQSYSVGPHHSSNSSAGSLHCRRSGAGGGAAFPADWKLLYNAHHFTDFLAVPIVAAPLDGADRPCPTSESATSAAGMLVAALGGGATSGASNAVVTTAAAAAMAVANASEGAAAGASSGGRQQIVGALTLYLSRPDRVSEQPPSIFHTPLEQDLVVLALAGVLFSCGPEPVRHVCELVQAVQSATGSGELAVAVAAGLTARLQHVFAVAPAALLALVPPKQVSAVVFRDLTTAAEAFAAGPGAIDSLAGGSSSQTLPLLHPALASVAGGGGGGGGGSGGANGTAATALYSGSHSHGGGGIRVQYRTAGIHLGVTDAGAPAGSIERSPSLLGTGLRGDGAATTNGGGGAAAAAAAVAGLYGGGFAVPDVSAGAVGGGGGSLGAARLCTPNSRSAGVLGAQNPSGLLTCRLDRMPSRYKALVFPLSHTLLQVLLQQGQEKKLMQGRGGLLGSGAVGAATAAAGARQNSALRDLCMSAAAAAAAPLSGVTRGGWIISDCNDHLHAVHSPSRDIYVMARVNARRPHSLVLVTADLVPSSAAIGGDGGGGADGSSSSATYIALYLAFPDRLPRALLELVMADVQLLMRRLLAPLIRHRFETNLSEEWSALAGAANNLPCPGGPVLRITSSMSASQARQVAGPGLQPSPSGTIMTTTGIQLAESFGFGGGGGGTASELHLEGLSAGEALQQMSVLVSSYMDTLQSLQGQLMASDSGSAGAADGKQSAWPAVSDRRVLQRSALELAVTASLSHPHIIQVYSLYTNMVLVKQRPPKPGTSGVQLLELSATTALNRGEEGIPCSALCMEYCDMGTLAHAIDQHRFLTVSPLGARRPALKAICTSLLEVALALRHLHARNLAHCDLKPANVLLKSSRRDSRGFTCKLADFGYVSVLKAATPGGRPIILPEEACGTVTHMAPETFIKGQPLDFSVDTFSFGILMWELYTCARPYSDVPEDQIAQRVTLKGLRPTFPPDTPRSFGALARQCWSQDPNERPTASEIVSALENLLQIMNTQLPAIPPLKPKPPAAPAPAAAAAPATAATAGPASDRGPAAPTATTTAAAALGVVVEKPMPAMPRARGSLNGGSVQAGGLPVTLSPLGRAPVTSPPAGGPLGAGGGAPVSAGSPPAVAEAC
ncbi:hypothetical protein VOLCADRAFT_120838 [Volvox carteri f. nagariensis]|uniref:Protein kinase domain-containing protein n=1 Tax=Volvox carteri f. nagariensis TaxID=3068 RepID=D8TUM1_VOLCA|nr:uncharacterized protein VOLCADRAFT_120838 [Volvox carteri f. nagariensis]EFJ48730.1 hypothetical protein VOLCADRAFT_120838 [Volvox carteri f. nagariensis]|eukprot:XP_002950062.1 hypothetical protein VOLCADRAFT_120838 [Volvox carteri f. nagariensis]